MRASGGINQALAYIGGHPTVPFNEGDLAEITGWRGAGRRAAKRRHDHSIGGLAPHPQTDMASIKMSKKYRSGGQTVVAAASIAA
jgi:hypothetical protein